MITPSFGLTATERVLPRLALDWTTGVSQPGVDVTRAGVATYVNSSGLVQAASADTQRIDYSTGTPGLLVEESRTNTAAYSEQFDQTYWTKTDSTITANASVSPDGSTTADKVKVNTNSAAHGVARTSLATAGTTNSISIFCKAGEITWVFFGNAYDGGLYVNLATGEQGTLSAGFSNPAVIPLANGWYRITLTYTPSSSGRGLAIYAADGDNQLVFSGANNTDGFFIWGAQAEQGAFATSYIPREAVGITRNADVATMTGTNFSDWFNATEGTFVVENTFSGVITSGSGAVVLGTRATAAAHPGFQFVTDAQNNRFLYRFYDESNSVVGAINYSTSITTGALYKSAISYKTNNFGVSVNGNNVSTDLSGTITGTPDLLGIGSSGTIQPITGHIQKLRYYPQRLTNAELQAFSK